MTPFFRTVAARNAPWHTNDDDGVFDPVAFHREVERRIAAQGGLDWEPWTRPGLRVIRLRLLSEPGCPVWDVSYCYGEWQGRICRVQLPFHQLPKRNLKAAIIQAAKEDGVYAKGIGILDCISRFQ